VRSASYGPFFLCELPLLNMMLMLLAELDKDS
jgi:hypothetical protein